MSQTDSNQTRGTASSRMMRYARLLDSSIRLPGGFRIGIEGLIGLVPGIGDAVGALLSSVILVEAYREGISIPVLLRMLVNIGLEMTLGAVPVIGDIFDFVFKANLRNARLMERHLEDATATRRRSMAWVIALAAALIVLIVLVAVVLWQLLWLLVNAVGSLL